VKRHSYFLIIETLLFAMLAGLSGLYLTAGFLVVFSAISPYLIRFPSYKGTYTGILFTLTAGLAAFWWVFRSSLFPVMNAAAGKVSVPIPETFSAFKLLFTRFSFELAVVSYLILLFSLLIFRIHRMRLSAKAGQERNG